MPLKFSSTFAFDFDIFSQSINSHEHNASRQIEKLIEGFQAFFRLESFQVLQLPNLNKKD